LHTGPGPRQAGPTVRIPDPRRRQDLRPCPAPDRQAML